MTKYFITAVVLWIFAVAGSEAAELNCYGNVDHETQQITMICVEPQGVLGRTWDSTKSIAADSWDWTKKTGSSAWSSTKSIAADSWDWTKKTGSSAWSSTKSGFNKVKAWWND